MCVRGESETEMNANHCHGIMKAERALFSAREEAARDESDAEDRQPREGDTDAAATLSLGISLLRHPLSLSSSSSSS